MTCRAVCTCGARFGSETALAQHVAHKQHKLPERYTCEICSSTRPSARVFYSKAAYQSHQMASHPGRKTVCEICSREFSSEEALRAHQSDKRDKQHVKSSSNKPSAATKPSDAVKTKTGNLGNSLPEQHATGFTNTNQEQPPTCNICLDTFQSAEKLHRHKTSKKHDPAYYCRECNSAYLKKESLEQHMTSLRHHSLGTFVCGCGKRFHSPSSVLLHLESHGCRDSAMQGEISRILGSFDSQLAGQANSINIGGLGQLLSRLMVREERAVGNEVNEGNDMQSDDGDSLHGVAMEPDGDSDDGSTSSWEKIHTPASSTMEEPDQEFQEAAGL